MKATVAILALLAISGAPVEASKTNPISQVVEMISGMETKIIAEGEQAQKVYSEFAEFCEDRSRQLQYEIKTGKQEVADLNAVIDKESADIEVLNSKISDLASSISEAESTLAESTAMRKKQAEDFSAEETELLSTISALERATDILQREAGSAAFVQLQNNGNGIVQALSAMVQASALSSADASKLTALVQSSSDSDEDDEDVNAPAASVYDNHSGGIIDTLESLQEKAQNQLSALRKTESESMHAFEMQKQALEDQIKFNNRDMDEAKKNLAACNERKASAEGDLSSTSKDLKQDITDLEDLRQDCMSKAEDYEQTTNSRAEELKALAEAKKVIGEMTGGATEQAYSMAQEDAEVSFLQVRSSGSDAVKYIRKLGKKLASAALIELSKRMASTIRMDSHDGADPFEKVKGLISEMLERLEKEASADATKQAWCVKENGETTDKKDDLDAMIEKLTVKMDQMTSESKKLREEVAVLSKELAELAATQAEMDKLRADEKAVYDENEPQMAQGLEGVKMALKILREYYAKDDKDHEAAEGAGASVIGLLEVAESDFSKMLAEMRVNEQTAAKSYEAESNDNAVTKVTKQKDVQFKTKTAAELDKKVAEIKKDLEGLNSELSAVMDYLKEIEEQCVAKPETYEERKKKREQELTGLKEALNILEGEAAFLQKNSHRRTLRGHATLAA